jgi:Rrf2 family protein
MITKKSKYAIKALIYLAKQEGDSPILIEEISNEERIPKKFLEAILLDLRKAGYLGSKKGKGGGYYLIKPAEQITMAEVLRLFDGPIALIPCVAHKYYEPCEECIDEVTCPIREVFRVIREQTVATLKDNNFGELVDKETKLKRYHVKQGSGKSNN